MANHDPYIVQSYKVRRSQAERKQEGDIEKDRNSKPQGRCREDDDGCKPGSWYGGGREAGPVGGY